MTDGFSDLADSLEDMTDEIESRTESTVKSGLDDVKDTAQRNLEQSEAIYTRRAKRSGSVVSKGDVTASLTFGGSKAPHVPTIEYGSGQFFGDGDSKLSIPDEIGHIDSPDGVSPEFLRNIEDWIDRKGIQARVVSQEELPWAIAQHIASKGVRPQPFLRPAWLKHRDSIKSSVRRDVRRAVRNV